jgi:hypothetical protein
MSGRLCLALALSLAACTDNEPATEIVVSVVGGGLSLDEARVDFDPVEGAFQVKTAPWPTADQLVVRFEVQEVRCNRNAGVWGCPPTSYEDYRATVGVNPGAPRLQAFGFRGGLEVARSERTAFMYTRHATTGPIVLNLVAATDRDAGADGP